MKIFVRILASSLLLLTIVLACTKDIALKTEVEFDLMEQHKAEGYVTENQPTTVTVVPEKILEEFSYSYSYTISEGKGYFRGDTGEILPQNQNIVLNPLSVTIMYVGSKPGEHIVKVTATDNYGFTEEIELDYTLAEIPPVVWTATSTINRIELGKSAQIRVTFEKSAANTETNYRRRYRLVAGSGTLMEQSEQGVDELDGFKTILPGSYLLKFTPDELGIIELYLELKGDDGEEFTAKLGFEVLEEIVDDVAPQTILLGNNPLTVVIGSNYVDPGATASDDVDGEISENIAVDASDVDTSVVGTYQVTYNVSDSAGNQADEVIRTVEVITGDNPQSAENDILAFALAGQEETAAIDAIGHMVNINVPFGTDINVAPIVFTLSYGATASPSMDQQQNFEKPVTYTVTAENGAEQEWVVTVIVGESKEKSIEKFTINGIDGLVTATEVMLTMPAGTDASALTPQIDFIGTGITPSSGSSADFTDSVIYTVTAEDGSTADYTVTVTVELSDEKEITSFKLDGVPGVFGGPSLTDITVNLPTGTDEKYLKPTITHTGESINPPSGIQQDFTNPLVYTVVAENGTQQTYTVTVMVEDDKPVARAAANPLNAFINQDINFTGSSSTDDVEVATYTWDFGDGNSSNSSDPVHRYMMHGTYIVTLTVTDDGGLTDTVNLAVDITNQAPKAKASASPTIVDIGETINFEGNLSSDDAGIVTYLWEFGDGITSNAINPVHSYAVEGNYTVTLTVTDSQGLSDSANLSITVNIPNRPPIAVASSDKTSGPNILTVNFNGSGSSDPDGNSLTYSWDFGDGTTSTQINPSHDFTVTGNYDVQLTVSDGKASRTDNLTIGVWAFNRDTGRYSAPPGSSVQVIITSIGSGKGSAYLRAHDGSNQTGLQRMGLTTSWNGTDTGTSTFLDEDENNFIMPPSGVVFFYGRHDDVISESQTYIDILNSDGGLYTTNSFIKEGFDVQQ